MNRALACGVVAGAGIILFSAGAMGEAVARLDAARTERAALAPVAPADPGIPPTLAVADADALAARLRARAARDGVLVEALSVRREGALAVAQLRVSGSPAAVLHFADAVERDRPLVRFAAWRIDAAGDAVRLQGRAVASWR